MKIIEKENKEVNVLKDVICDCCGKSCKDGIADNFECATITANWGYASKKDMEKWTAQICEKCIDEKFSFVNFKKEEMHFQTTIGTDSEMEDKIDDVGPYPGID